MRYWIVFSFLVILAVSVRPVQACSSNGGAWNDFLPRLINSSGVVVVGQYAELDDAGVNGIFHVSGYLKGQGAEYLTISAIDLAWIEDSLHGGRYYGCWEQFFPVSSLQTQGEYVYFLNRQDNGIYKISEDFYFQNDEDTIRVGDSAEELYELTIDGLSREIINHTGQVALAPLANSAYPRTTPILLKSLSSHYYVLPVDSSEPMAVSPDAIVELQRNQYDCYAPCTAFSPNGLDKVYLWESDSDFISINNDLSPTVEHNLVGQRIAFSPTSESFAVWQDNRIELYMLWYPQLNYPDDSIEQMYTAALVNTIVSESSLNYPAAWSPDGRTLALSDEAGLWLWDVFSVDYPPQLLIPASETVPTVRYFSPQGRYLAITDGARRYNLDLVTRRELPDGYVSPNDRILLVFDTAASEATSVEVMYLAPEQASYEYYAEVQYYDVQWIDDAYFIASVTGFSYLAVDEEATGNASGDEVFLRLVEEPFYDVKQYPASGMVSSYGYIVPYAVNSIQMRDFYYEAEKGLIEIGVDGSTLLVNGRPVSLSPYLDEAIVEAVWLPSAFYYER